MSKLVVTLAFLTSLFTLSSVNKEDGSISHNRVKTSSIKRTIAFVKRHTLLHAKARGTLFIKIDKISTEALASQQSIISLRATIVARRNLPNINYQWSFPEGVTVVDGEKSDTLGAIKNGESFTVTLKIQSPSEKNNQIFLHSYSETPNNGRLGYTTSLMTQDKIKPQERHLKSLNLFSKSKKSPEKKIPPFKIIQ